ncbi:FAD-dependent oxidoreductase [Deinococcus sp.]|uniref:FAD-dependent oxidoreductase n=1 Tax=Deinococcus sp. TaxID=47478 RepID=UPI0025BFA3AC|nr:FAD-dependent oxidoreductase [Deinococcus sp.]
MKAVVIGGGVAGAAVAYFLGQAGMETTVIDAGTHAASHVPSALINPVRGQSGQVDADALEGMHFTWGLIRELETQGHRVPHARSGVLRPLPDDRSRAKFGSHLPAGLNHDWVRPAAPLAPGWAHVLWLPEAGWVAGKPLCRALLAASGASVVAGRATAWTSDRVTVQPADQTGPATFQADAVIFCGGSAGSTWAGETATHRMGSVLKLDRAVSGLPLSFGAYLSPTDQGGVLGGTFEAPAPGWRPPELPLKSLVWLLDKGEALANLGGVSVTGRWTGSRLSGLQAGPDERGVWRLSGLGSKGFLLGPLLAARLVHDLCQSLGHSAGVT